MSNKHDANVRKSALVNFQIGLIASLLFTYFMFEVYTAVPVLTVVDPDPGIEEPVVEWNEAFTVYKEPKPKELAVKRTKPVVDPQEYDIKKDNEVLNEMDTEFKSKVVETSAPVTVDSLPDEIDEEPISYPFTKIEWVPIFPGCEKLKTNKERAACFSEKIGRIVSRRFNTGLGEEYGLTGLQRIHTQFDVNAEGVITNVQVRASHPRLEKEARRVIGKFPKMTPGKQRDRNVTVKYQLPIVFKIQE